MNIILGAGMCGMAAGIKTGFPIYEQSSQAGGICNDYVKQGFTFCNGGGHYLFGKGPGLDYVKSLFPVNEIERKAGVYYNHTFPYPFQSNVPSGWSIHTPKREILKDWLMDTFGQDQCALFFHPFNEKYTAGLYDKIIQTDAYKSPKTGNGFCPTFCDPVNGLSDLVDKMASKCDIKYDMKAKRVDANNKTILFNTGDSISYNKLISTIPLNNLLWICGKQEESNKLPYTSVLVINIGAEPDVNTPKEHWMYIPFCKNNFYRVGFYSNINKNKAPKGKVSLSVEMAFHNTKFDDLDLPKIVHNVISELQSWRWIGETIVFDPTWVPCAYTWLYDRKDRDDAIAWLKERDIYSIGRYGKWNFQGIVQSIEDGFNVDIYNSR